MDKENIYTLINKIMSETGAVEKNSKNTSQNYAFRGIDELYSALQPPLVKYGVFFCTDVEKIEQTHRESKQGAMLTCTVLTCRFTFYAPDGSSIVVRTVGEGMDSGDKSCSKAMSTALKYALLQLFCIPTSEPKDSENDSPEPVYKRESEVTVADWQRLEQIGSGNKWPKAYMKVYLDNKKKTGRPLTEIYEDALARFGQMNTNSVEDDTKVAV
jgi:hypothetical protein